MDCSSYFRDLSSPPCQTNDGEGDFQEGSNGAEEKGDSQGCTSKSYRDASAAEITEELHHGHGGYGCASVRYEVLQILPMEYCELVQMACI